MKRIRINTGQVGLVFKNGEYRKVLTAGSHWVHPFADITKLSLNKPFNPVVDLNVLLRDEKLADLLTIVEVGDTELVLQYENGNFVNLLTPGRYAFWKGLTKYHFVKADTSQAEVGHDVNAAILRRADLVKYIKVCHLETYEKALLFVDGTFTRILDSGVYHFWASPRTVSVMKADMRQLQLEVTGQEILTKDKAALRVNFTTQYQVVDIRKALLENKDYEKQLYVMTQLALREFIGTMTLDELLEKKEEVSPYVLKTLKEMSADLGIKVTACGIKDIILPGEVKEIMSQVLVAQKKAQANIITRREETASTRSLLNTARLMEENAMLFKLKEMEYVEKIAERIDSISLSGGNQIVDQLKTIFSK